MENHDQFEDLLDQRHDSNTSEYVTGATKKQLTYSGEKALEESSLTPLVIYSDTS